MTTRPPGFTAHTLRCLLQDNHNDQENPMTDPFAALEALAGRWQDAGDAEGATADDDRTITLWVNAGNQLRAAIAEARAQMGEVEVREEHAIKHRDGGVGFAGTSLDAMRALVADPLKPGAVAVVKRTVTTTRHVTDWEPVE